MGSAGLVAVALAVGTVLAVALAVLLARAIGAWLVTAFAALVATFTRLIAAFARLESVFAWLVIVLPVGVLLIAGPIVGTRLIASSRGWYLLSRGWP